MLTINLDIKDNVMLTINLNIKDNSEFYYLILQGITKIMNDVNFWTEQKNEGLKNNAEKHLDAALEIYKQIFGMEYKI